MTRWGHNRARRLHGALMEFVDRRPELIEALMPYVERLQGHI
jgi:hypothetical protein